MICTKKLFAFSIAVFLFASCKKQDPDSVSHESGTFELDSTEEFEGTVDASMFLAELQGTWKRVDYPFSTLVIQESTEKLISEGMAEEPSFIDFELSMNCRYADEAHVELESKEFIKMTPFYEACEFIKVNRDT
ncbi:hypothetical protein [Nonlabens marinus]|uniref:Uncharacterized protein n=1 Tax=Nonlabens marinus S1-08 TaxID=1454201 RepID=W8VWI9_9FLAO|nr:hypothetical protein [Nonlabens marinus]BAO56383.1 hypothetical protein NMS_2374 [Nonlabens marinus S1-08]